jgi:hypothetical protein
LPGRQAQRFLWAILPFLREKHEQAMLACILTIGPTGIGRSGRDSRQLSSDELGLRKKVDQELRRLKRVEYPKSAA